MSDIMQVFYQEQPAYPIQHKIWDVPFGLYCQSWDSEEQKLYDNYLCNYFSSYLTYVKTELLLQIRIDNTMAVLHSGLLSADCKTATAC